MAFWSGASVTWWVVQGAGPGGASVACAQMVKGQSVIFLTLDFQLGEIINISCQLR